MNEKYFSIIATIGPSCNSLDALIKLKNAGVTVFRVNMSHSSIEDLKKFGKIGIKHNIRIGLDTEGAQIRTKLKGKHPFNIKKGDIFKIINPKTNTLSNKEMVLYPLNIFEKIDKGFILRLDFNGACVRILEKTNLELKCEAISSGLVNNNRGVDILNKSLYLPDFTNKDLQAFELLEDLKIKDVFISFCQSKEAVNKLKELKKDRDIFYDDILKDVDSYCEPEILNAEDPLFILYTSGSTGKPKGVMHTTGGYIVYASMTHEYIFNYNDGDIYWCTADIGWITGHSYIIYGPLANGATTLMFEGVPNYPDFSRFWQIVDKHKVNIFYTAPTAIRALMREGDDYVTKTTRSSLKLLGTVGEPINPEAWKWYYEVPGNSKCPIVDTWWQTETGGILISPQTGAIKLKPGSASKPFFGIEPCIVDKEGNELEGECEGMLCMKRSWPGQMRTVYGDHKRFIDTYFSQFDGKYFTGDGCKRDKDGYYWITGRVDDVIIVSGHNLGTAEIESAFVSHKDVSEAAVVGYPHDVKGNGLYCYVSLKVGVDPSDVLLLDLKIENYNLGLTKNFQQSI